MRFEELLEVALADRVRPYNKSLEWELRHHPLEGFGDVVDGWEPDVARLRGQAEYRA